VDNGPLTGEMERELRRLCGVVSPATRWSYPYAGEVKLAMNTTPRGNTPQDRQAAADAAFIHHARLGIPALLAEIDRLRGLEASHGD
jgi:hypothetical protein